MSDNVISLTPPTGNPDIIEDFRTMLSDAQNARVVSYVAVCVDHHGKVTASYFFDSKSHELALGSVINAERINTLTE